jgi:hypothetical protein
LNSLLTGKEPSESLALLQAPRQNRGQSFLPALQADRHQEEPHRLPLNDRTRNLMLRKLERASLPQQPVDHPIDFELKVGDLPGQTSESLPDKKPETDAQKAGGRRGGDLLTPDLRRKLGALAKEQAEPDTKGDDPSISS